MANTTITLFGETHTPVAVVLTSNEELFISLRLGREVTVILPGSDRAAVAYAQQMIATLTAAVNAIEQAQRLSGDAPDPAPEAVSS